jgi:hypothetical protein
LFNTANGETETPTVIATSCSGFEADAHKLFDKRGNAALSGTFAAGDHVHLAIDLRDAGYSWENTLFSSTSRRVGGVGVLRKVYQGNCEWQAGAPVQTGDSLGVPWTCCGGLRPLTARQTSDA